MSTSGSNSKKIDAPTQQQLNRLTPYIPSTDKWYDYYMKQAAGQRNPQFTKRYNEGSLKPMVVSEVEASIDQATSDVSEEKKQNKSSTNKARPTKRKQPSQGGGRGKRSRGPKDIFD